MSSHDNAPRPVPSSPPAATVPSATEPPRKSSPPTTAPQQSSPQPTSPQSDPSTVLRPGTVYQLRRDLVSLPESLRLRNVEWGVLFAVTGEHTVAQISSHFGLEGAEQAAVFSRLLREGLIVEREVSYGEYLRAASTVRDDKPQTLARFLRAGVTFGPVARALSAGKAPNARALSQGKTAHSPLGAGRPAVASQPVTSPDPAPRQTAGRPNPAAQRPVQGPVAHVPVTDVPELHQTRAVPTFSREQLAAFEPLQQLAPAASPAKSGAPLASPPAPPSVEPRQPRQLSLKRVMEFILDRAPDLNAGQLDVYRVFIRVNTKLLRRNGINTLRFEEDRLIKDPELQGAITASVEKTLGLSCPESVFVAA